MTVAPDNSPIPSSDLEQQRQGPTRSERLVLGAYLHGAIILLVYLIACFWPVVTAQDAEPRSIKIASFDVGSFTPDLALMWAVGLLGALGGSLHGAGSFVNYIGNRTFVRSWTWFYLARAPVGLGLALLVYMGLRGGLLNPAASTDQASKALNPYGMGALAALTGLFSETATLKLREVFTALFRPEEVRKNPLEAAAPTVTETEPKTVKKGAGDTEITVRGSSFEASDTVMADDQTLATTFVDATSLKATIPASMLTAKRDLKIAVRRAGPGGVVSGTVTFEVSG